MLFAQAIEIFITLYGVAVVALCAYAIYAAFTGKLVTEEVDYDNMESLRP